MKLEELRNKYDELDEIEPQIQKLEEEEEREINREYERSKI